MFGLFKNLTPEGKLERDVKQSMEKQIASYVKETRGIEAIMGITIDAATRAVYQSYIDNAYLFARGHGISYVKTINIITRATNEIRNKYLVNPLPIV